MKIISLRDYPKRLLQYTQEYSFSTRPRFYNDLVHQTHLATTDFHAVVSPNDSTLYSDAWIKGNVYVFSPRQEDVKRYILLSVLDKEGNVLWSQNGGNVYIPETCGGEWFTVRIFCNGSLEDLKRARDIQKQIRLMSLHPIPYQGLISEQYPWARFNPFPIPLDLTSVTSGNAWVFTREVGSACANAFTRAFVCQYIFGGNRLQDTLYFFQWVFKPCTGHLKVNPPLKEYGFWSLSFYTLQGFFSNDLPKSIHSYDQSSTTFHLNVPCMIVFRVYDPKDINWIPSRISWI